MTIALTAAQWQGWVAVVGGLAAAIVGLLKYFDFRSRRERAAAAGQAFIATVDALASEDEAKQLAGAILLRRFFDPATEQGERTTPYADEAVRVIAALLRGATPGTLQKLLADGLAFAPSLQNADLQNCVLVRAYLGVRPDREPDLTQADFFESDLTEASLKQVNACEAVFYRATLRRTVLRGTDLTKADFRDAILEGTDFREADLKDAKFAGATIDGARFEGARNVPDDLRVRLGEQA
jgi:uncharacterized protein YjbI with pentapeptide repeats